MPSFCRHNRLIQNCPICSREQAIEMRPVVSSSAPRANQPSPPGAPGARSMPRPQSPRRSASAGSGLRVRRLEREADDGYRAWLVPGLRSSGSAERLAEELAFATARLNLLESDPPGLYAEVAGAGPSLASVSDERDLEQRTWLAFLVAYLCPLDDDDPFAGIRPAITSWEAADPPALEDVPLGPRTAHDPARGAATVDAYRAWASRAGSQAAAFRGEPAWTPERRFARVFERLALPGLHRDARFDLLVTLGRLGAYELRAATLALGGENEATLAAKRVFGIGDTMLLERRAAELARACGVPLEALDLALYNWGRGERATLGADPETPLDQDALGSSRSALGL